jgi:hypothetical protein
VALQVALHVAHADVHVRLKLLLLHLHGRRRAGAERRLGAGASLERSGVEARVRVDWGSE